ncbi:prenyltransferase/squalene oxidase repeat-containing protein [Roseimaritima ulvae]|uniref:Squalene cyclase C-terminal domain-containing protein n=1 Tax=Roseimaritima ulvae TaxID=980254 RepID=A0A5B9QX69_9BACT|nr:hypothetical protein [Roseimaritima ulvae]QEG42400.1 hypothetical protein UC8_44350 [Roseimaritima ulvae]
MTVSTPPIDNAPPVLPAAPPVQADSAPGQRAAVAAAIGKGWAALRNSDQRVPAWLVSMLLHMAVLLTLALWSMPPGGSGRRTLQLSLATASDAPPLPLELLQQPDPLRNDNSQAAEQPTKVPIALAAPPQIADRSPLEPQAPRLDPVAAATAAVAQADDQAIARPLPSGGGLAGRSPQGRQKFGLEYGATPESEAAVEAALRWLANHQRNDGSWSFDLSGKPCNGQCDNPRHNPDRLPAPPTAATGLALLAFLGAGYTHESGPYQEQVDRGLYYLRGQMRPTDFGSDLQLGSMYGHGIATLAIVEAASMTEDAELRLLAEELTLFILAARHPTSSWGYTPGAPGDITLTGWQVMALKGAKRLHISMPTDVFDRCKNYVDSLSPDGGVHFGYREPSEAKTPTAIGLTLQIYLGRSPLHRSQQAGMTQLLDWGPKFQNVYHDYYASLALHHARHPQWDAWQSQVRDHLVRTQAVEGHEAGSWHFKDHYGDVGGRLYTTAMCAMILEVYYRYLPLYSESSEFPL